MTQTELERKLSYLLSLPGEIEWVEFKENNTNPIEIGQYISALANSACLANQDHGYLIWGIEDNTRMVVGTKFQPSNASKGSQNLELWLNVLLDPRLNIHFFEFTYQDKTIVLLRIPAAINEPVKFKGEAYIRIGSHKTKLSAHPNREREIWKKNPHSDWSAEVIEDASIEALSPEAITKARQEYKKKYPRQVNEVDEWTDIEFLNKAKVTRNGKVTNTAILLLGNKETEELVHPAIAEVTWVLEDKEGNRIDYEHFHIPFILNSDAILAKIRNLRFRYLPDNTLFTNEVDTYDPYVIREALHNCIAHQDYSLGRRINVVEKDNELVFTNAGTFLPGSVESVISDNAPPDFYRNKFLANAMVNLNMIDTIGSGIRRMYDRQRQRFFPLPTYDFSVKDRVTLKIPGHIIDENYTRILINEPKLPIELVMLLDRIQKHKEITKEDAALLRKRGMIEGKYPNIYIAAPDGSSKEDDYKQLVVDLLMRLGEADRKGIDALLLKRLPTNLTEKQKKDKIKNILYTLAKKQQLIKNIGSDTSPIWILNKKND